MRTLACWICLVVSPCAFLQAEDAKLLQGTWKAVAVVDNGKKYSPGMYDGIQMVVRGDEFVIVWAKNLQVPTKFTLDTTKNPHHIDLVATQGAVKGNKVPGLYSLDGDTLLLCLSLFQENVRPAERKSEPGKRMMFFKLERTKPEGNP